MKTFARALAAGTLALLAASLMAVDVVGAWKGKVSFDAAAMPKPQNEQQRKAMNDGLAGVKKLQLSLVLKANKTYLAEARNVPGKTETQKSEGTWKQDGNVLWLTAVKENGKAPTDKKPQKFLILEKGKKLSVAAEGMPTWVKITFTR